MINDKKSSAYYYLITASFVILHVSIWTNISWKFQENILIVAKDFKIIIEK